MKFSRVSILVATLAIASEAHAEVCDYRPSSLVGKAATTIGTAISSAPTAARAGLQAAGYYTLVHAGSGLTMLGSTAAGTAEIIAGSGGVAGTVGAILMAPTTLVIGGVAIIGVGAFEGACYFQVERITDPYEVRKIIESVALEDEAVSIVQTEDGDAMSLRVLGETQTYLLRNLYIANGQLKYRDFGPNTNLGPILYTSEAKE